ncbi:hypothetical protein D0Z07_9256 [Hyphodiscus hymeniophilus]|uniref:Uncharacterized protein n=1 Tax=Hyphodiscus hymeniophilus TaxID=353542 RepID=A0A9P6SMC6_9HELO|nr:hypothetical protein D0Z07_9256 [Hyphodiscus hymeniophilus]
MFFFLNFRESRNGTIEPGFIPFHNPTEFDSEHHSFREYITNWDISRQALVRRLACILAVCFHVPMNLISVLSYVVSLQMFFGIIISVLNLLCVGIAMWKLDVMSGQKLFFNKTSYDRTHFDYIILGSLIVYGSSFGVFVFARMWLRDWVWFFRIVWPCLIATDIFTFMAGWIGTWRDTSITL